MLWGSIQQYDKYELLKRFATSTIFCTFFLVRVKCNPGSRQEMLIYKIKVIIYDHI